MNSKKLKILRMLCRFTNKNPRDASYMDIIQGRRRNSTRVLNQDCGRHYYKAKKEALR